MRPLTAFGIVLAILGSIVLMRGLSYRDEQDLVRIGDARVTVTEQKGVPQWVGIAALAGGALLVVADLRKRRTA